MEKEKHFVFVDSKGKPVSFETVQKAVSTTVFQLYHKLNIRQRDVEDICAYALEKVYSSISSYDPQKSSPKTWVSTIARNSVIDWNYKYRDVIRIPKEMKKSNAVQNELEILNPELIQGNIISGIQSCPTDVESYCEDDGYYLGQTTNYVFMTEVELNEEDSEFYSEQPDIEQDEEDNEFYSEQPDVEQDEEDSEFCSGQHFQGIPDVDNIPDLYDYESEFINNEEREWLLKHLPLLDSRSRSVLEGYLVDKKRKEIAEELGLKPQDVSNIHCRAIETLQRMYEHEFASVA